MSDQPALSEVADQVARRPASTTVDGVQVQQHNLKDLDAIAHKAAASKAVRKRNRGLFFSKLVPGGAND